MLKFDLAPCAIRSPLSTAIAEWSGTICYRQIILPDYKQFSGGKFSNYLQITSFHSSAILTDCDYTVKLSYAHGCTYQRQKQPSCKFTVGQLQSVGVWEYYVPVGFDARYFGFLITELKKHLMRNIV